MGDHTDCFAGMEDSLANGTYLELKPGESCSTWMTCEIFEGEESI